MKYVALLTGQGEGCDHTIGCNKKFVVFEATGVSAALKECKRLWKYHGGADGEPRVEKIELYAITETVEVPVKQWNETGAEESERELAEEELRKVESRAKELRSKLASSGDGH
jgi:predicted RNase H-like nuclease